MRIEQPPNVALIGYGIMGREIERTAHDLGVPVVLIVDTNLPDKAHSLTRQTLEGVDVCIEFTQPDAVLANIEAVAKAGKHIVLGTTGWDRHRDVVRAMVADCGIGMVYASNFSLGMNIFYEILRHTGIVFDMFDSYDCHIHEIHHARKKDAPSGTSIHLARELMKGLKRKTLLETSPGDGSRQPEVLRISSSRVGDVPGVHTVLFDSHADTIELRHTVRNRRGFAEGALLAADWIKNRKGFHTMEDLLNDIRTTT